MGLLVLPQPGLDGERSPPHTHTPPKHTPVAPCVRGCLRLCYVYAAARKSSVQGTTIDNPEDDMDEDELASMYRRWARYSAEVCCF